MSLQIVTAKNTANLEETIIKLRKTVRTFDPTTTEPSLAIMAASVRLQDGSLIDDRAFKAFVKTSDAIVASATDIELAPLLDLWSTALSMEKFECQCAPNNQGLFNFLTRIMGGAHHDEEKEDFLFMAGDPLQDSGLRLVNYFS